jgi:2-polyprenyl-6-methoxyphenol hydroxylase-like FAD-dependent oxidoreductase
MDSPSVLIVGAGPTGLVLALGLARRGVRLRIVDQAPGPGEHSRAMVVHARTLELYRQFGIAEAVIAEGVKVERLRLREGGAGRGREMLSAGLGELGGDMSPYPFALAYAQDQHERFLIGELAKLGVEVERQSRLARLDQDGSGVRAVIARPDGAEETIEAAYLCGCDGAHSQTRESLGVGFPGGIYEQVFYVADVRIDRGFDPDFYINLGKDLLALMLPVRAGRSQRLIGLVPRELAGRSDLEFEDIRPRVESLLGLRVTWVEWFSRYRVHHRVAERFRVGRVFLLGDAGHVHSPTGGQGMNTGVGDAVNLAWKLAQVLQGRAAPALFDSYEPERIGFARQLVQTTDRLFTVLVAGGAAGEIVRRLAAPLLVGSASRLAAARHAAFRLVSQIRLAYPESPLSSGRAGKVRAGDRLPWTGVAGPDNFAPLASLDWQVQVHGALDPAVSAACARLGLPVHVLDWSKGARRAGIRRDGLYLVRPDGYVGLAMETPSAAALDSYAAERSLRFV